MIIELKDITKTFTDRSWRTLLLGKKPQRFPALNAVSMDIGPGEAVGLLGPNGAGKTTLIKIIATLIVPDSGDVTVCGHSLRNEPHLIRRDIGLVNTNARSFYWRLTGRQNLEFFAALHQASHTNENTNVDELLDFVGLKEKANARFMKYSTGQQQRLALARALLSSPQVLLMDEPTSSLDPVAASGFRKFIREELIAKQGKTVLWCTHNLKEAEEVCDLLTIIHKGSIIASGSLANMRALMEGDSFFSVKTDRWPKDGSEKFGFAPIRAFRNNGCMVLEFRVKEAEIPDMLKHLVSSGINVYGCTHKQIPLETIFEKLIHLDTDEHRSPGS